MQDKGEGRPLPGSALWNQLPRGQPPLDAVDILQLGSPKRRGWFSVKFSLLIASSCGPSSVVNGSHVHQCIALGWHWASPWTSLPQAHIQCLKLWQFNLQISPWILPLFFIFLATSLYKPQALTWMTYMYFCLQSFLITVTEMTLKCPLDHFKCLQLFHDILSHLEQNPKKINVLLDFSPSQRPTSSLLFSFFPLHWPPGLSVLRTKAAYSNAYKG